MTDDQHADAPLHTPRPRRVRHRLPRWQRISLWVLDKLVVALLVVGAAAWTNARLDKQRSRLDAHRQLDAARRSELALALQTLTDFRGAICTTVDCCEMGCDEAMTDDFLDRYLSEFRDLLRDTNRVRNTVKLYAGDETVNLTREAMLRGLCTMSTCDEMADVLQQGMTRWVPEPDQLNGTFCPPAAGPRSAEQKQVIRQEFVMRCLAAERALGLEIRRVDSEMVE